LIRSLAVAPALARPRIALLAEVISARLARPLLIFAVTAGLASLLYISQASGVATTGYDIQTLEAQRQQWLARNEQARARIAALESLDRVEVEARMRLQMSAPKGILFVAVEPSVVVPTVPDRPDARSPNSTPADLPTAGPAGYPAGLSHGAR